MSFTQATGPSIGYSVHSREEFTKFAANEIKHSFRVSDLNPWNEGLQIRSKGYDSVCVTLYNV